jgi:L-amino acid N-acyltransferase YncA
LAVTSGHYLEVLVRPALEVDLPAMLDILNREIREGVAHFGLEEQTLDELERDFAGAEGRYPWYVAEEGEVVLGFAKAGPWKTRGAYARTTEVGVYVAAGQQSKGVGSALYNDFIPALFEAGFHSLVAGIRLPNDPCVRLHEKFGFSHVGVFPEQGFKFGQWHDVGYWTLVGTD